MLKNLLRLMVRLIVKVMKIQVQVVKKVLYPLVDMYLISEKSIWKNQVLELDFKSISNLIFTACVACKNQF